MLELTRTWPRWVGFAVVAVPLLLVAIALAVYRLVGPVAAILLVAGGNALLLATLILVAAHRLRGTGSASDEPPSRTRNAFLSWLTHELRSPLNACVMWLDVLALAPQGDKVTQAVAAIKRNLARQTRLVSDLSDAAKIGSGGLGMQLAPIDLVALLNSHVDTWQLLAIGKQLTFEHRIEPAVAPVDADSDRLLQALNHLLDDAIASTPAGGHVQVRLHDGGGSWIVQVEDTGAGLSQEDAANLGAPLWRAPAAAKSRPGLGMGLAVAHHIAATHGGTLTATSKDAGALFTLTLPLAVAGDRDPTRLRSANDPPRS